MPIITKHGSIFDSTADVLVCPVNCVGVMGKGLALEFKQRWSQVYQLYKYVCGTGVLVPGGIYMVPTYIILAATKDHWANPSRIEWIESCVNHIREESANFDSIAIPQLGCGCGGLDWGDVWPLYQKHLGDLPATVEVWIYE